MKYTKELAVGTSLVIAALILILGVRFFRDLPLFGGTYRLNTTIEDAGGLQAGNAVRVNGVRVGAVDAVELDPETNRVLVRFHVDEEIAVPEGSHATVGGIAALASMHMTVHLGPRSNARIEEGGFIPSRTNGGLLASVTEKAPVLATNLESVLTNANSTLEQAEVLFASAGGDVQQTLSAFRSAATALENLLRAQQEDLSSTISNLESFTGDMSAFSAESADSLSLVVRKLNRSMSGLEASLASLEASTKTLDEILNKINHGEGTMSRLLNDPSLYAKLDSSLTNLNGLLEEFRSNPRRYLEHMSLVEIF